MKILTILTLFILSVPQLYGQQKIMGYTFGQPSNDLKAGDEILATQNIKSKCLTYTVTPDGIYIGTRNDKNIPVNFLKKDKVFVQISSLNGFTIFGYLKANNSLIVTSYNSKSSDIITDDLFTYSISLRRINSKIHDRKHGNLYNVAVKGDSVICLITIKRVNQAGSDVEPKIIVF